MISSFRFKYLVVCFNGDRATTGFASRVRNVVSEMGRFGGRVLVVRFVPVLHRGRSWHGNWGVAPGVSLLEIPALPISRFGWLRSLSVSINRLLLRFCVWLTKPEIIQCECHEAASLAIHHSFSARVYLDLHGAAPEEARYARLLFGNTDMSIVDWMDYVEREATRQFDKVIAVTANLIRHIERKTGLSLGARAVTFPILPDPSFLKPLDKAGVKAKVGLTEKVVFLYSGGMQDYQCVEATLKWFLKLSQRIPGSFLLILTPAVDVAMEKVARVCGKLTPDIRIASIKPDDLSDYISAADFGFVLRDAELLNQVSSPTKAVEYLARGVRVLCTRDSGNAPDYVNRFNAGLTVSMVPTEDEVEQTANAIGRLMSQCLPMEMIHNVLSRDSYFETLRQLYESPPSHHVAPQPGSHP